MSSWHTQEEVDALVRERVSEQWMRSLKGTAASTRTLPDERRPLSLLRGARGRSGQRDGDVFVWERPERRLWRWRELPRLLSPPVPEGAAGGAASRAPSAGALRSAGGAGAGGGDDAAAG